MGFQIPPTLPDYSKLVFMLNSSGVQEWNPAVYDILKNLIAAVGQSQDVITTNITNATLVNVSPTGALNGDGTLANPLAVKVDGITVNIVNDKLSSSLIWGTINIITVKIVPDVARLANTAPILIIPAPGVNLYNEIIFATVRGFISGLWFYNAGLNAGLYYATGAGVPSTIKLWDIGTYIAGPTFNGWECFATQVGATIDVVTGVDPNNAPIYLKSGGNTTLSAGPPFPSINDCVTIVVGYITRIILTPLP